MTAYRTHADLGGQCGHGRIDRRADEGDGRPFHADWQARALAVVLAAGAMREWNLDISRSTRETLPDYASLDYYSIWLRALETLLVGRGLASQKEIAAGRSLRPPKPVEAKLLAEDVAAVLARGSPTRRDDVDAPPPRYAAGDRVVAYAGVVPHHTRLPAYVRGKVGRIERLHGRHVFADAHALGLGPVPEWLYTVSFEGRELWPADAGSADVVVSIDAWQPYLAPAPA